MQLAQQRTPHFESSSNLVKKKENKTHHLVAYMLQDQSFHSKLILASENKHGTIKVGRKSCINKQQH